MPCDAAGLALAARPRADDEIAATGADRLDQRSDAPNIVGAIAIHEHQDVGILRRHGRGQARPAVAAPGIDDIGAGIFGAQHGGIAAAAVGHDDAAHEVARQAAHDLADRGFLVQRRDDDHDGPLPGLAPDDAIRIGGNGHAQRLQRRPQLAQAAAGLSDNSASRNER